MTCTPSPRTRGPLASVVEQHWFERQRSVVFEFVSHFASVDEWLSHRQRRRATSVIDPAVIERAHELLAAASQGELLVSEHVLATRLRQTTPGAARN